MQQALLYKFLLKNAGIGSKESADLEALRGLPPVPPQVRPRIPILGKSRRLQPGIGFFNEYVGSERVQLLINHESELLSNHGSARLRLRTENLRGAARDEGSPGKNRRDTVGQLSSRASSVGFSPNPSVTNPTASPSKPLRAYDFLAHT